MDNLAARCTTVRHSFPQIPREELEAELTSSHIMPGSLWENGRCESFNGRRLRDELLNGENFCTLKEA